VQVVQTQAPQRQGCQAAVDDGFVPLPLHPVAGRSAEAELTDHADTSAPARGALGDGLSHGGDRSGRAPPVDASAVEELHSRIAVHCLAQRGRGTGSGRDDRGIPCGDTFEEEGHGHGCQLVGGAVEHGVMREAAGLRLSGARLVLCHVSASSGGRRRVPDSLRAGPATRSDEGVDGSVQGLVEQLRNRRREIER
jgi:hypothetical protein